MATRKKGVRQIAYLALGTAHTKVGYGEKYTHETLLLYKPIGFEKLW